MAVHTDSKEKALLIAAAAAEKKGDDIVLLDVRQHSSLGDFFLIISATTPRRIDTITGFIEQRLRAVKKRMKHREGGPNSPWVILDCGDVIVHVFLKEARAFYDLERLWSMVSRERLDEQWLLKTHITASPPS